MDWKSLGEKLVSVGLPILGNALVPGGGTIVALVANALGLGVNATPDQIATAVSTNPDNIVKLKELQDRHEEVLIKVAYDAENRNIEAVNKTLQTEAMGGSWIQRNHHALESMGTVALVWAVYFILPILKIPVPVIPETAWITLGAILGVTAWMRGQANVAVAKT
jgi:hypothetical protein